MGNTNTHFGIYKINQSAHSEDVTDCDGFTTKKRVVRTECEEILRRRLTSFPSEESSLKGTPIFQNSQHAYLNTLSSTSYGCRPMTLSRQHYSRQTAETGHPNPTVSVDRYSLRNNATPAQFYDDYRLKYSPYNSDSQNNRPLLYGGTNNDYSQTRSHNYDHSYNNHYNSNRYSPRQTDCSNYLSKPYVKYFGGGGNPFNNSNPPTQQPDITSYPNANNVPSRSDQPSPPDQTTNTKTNNTPKKEEDRPSKSNDNENKNVDTTSTDAYDKPKTFQAEPHNEPKNLHPENVLVPDDTSKNENDGTIEPRQSKPVVKDNLKNGENDEGDTTQKDTLYKPISLQAVPGNPNHGTIEPKQSKPVLQNNLTTEENKNVDGTPKDSFVKPTSFHENPDTEPNNLNPENIPVPDDKTQISTPRNEYHDTIEPGKGKHVVQDNITTGENRNVYATPKDSFDKPTKSQEDPNTEPTKLKSDNISAPDDKIEIPASKNEYHGTIEPEQSKPARHNLTIGERAMVSTTSKDTLDKPISFQKDPNTEPNNLNPENIPAPNDKTQISTPRSEYHGTIEPEQSKPALQKNLTAGKKTKVDLTHKDTTDKPTSFQEDPDTEPNNLNPRTTILVPDVKTQTLTPGNEYHGTIEPEQRKPVLQTNLTTGERTKVGTTSKDTLDKPTSVQEDPNTEPNNLNPENIPVPDDKTQTATPTNENHGIIEPGKSKPMLQTNLTTGERTKFGTTSKDTLDKPTSFQEDPNTEPNNLNPENFPVPDDKTQTLTPGNEYHGIIEPGKSKPAIRYNLTTGKKTKVDLTHHDTFDKTTSFQDDPYAVPNNLNPENISVPDDKTQISTPRNENHGTIEPGKSKPAIKYNLITGKKTKIDLTHKDTFDKPTSFQEDPVIKPKNVSQRNIVIPDEKTQISTPSKESHGTIEPEKSKPVIKQNLTTVERTKVGTTSKDTLDKPTSLQEDPNTEPNNLNPRTTILLPDDKTQISTPSNEYNGTIEPEKNKPIEQNNLTTSENKKVAKNTTPNDTYDKPASFQEYPVNEPKNLNLENVLTPDKKTRISSPNKYHGTANNPTKILPTIPPYQPPFVSSKPLVKFNLTTEEAVKVDTKHVKPVTIEVGSHHNPIPTNNTEIGKPKPSGVPQGTRIPIKTPALKKESPPHVPLASEKGKPKPNTSNHNNLPNIKPPLNKTTDVPGNKLLNPPVATVQKPNRINKTMEKPTLTRINHDKIKGNSTSNPSKSPKKTVGLTKPVQRRVSSFFPPALMHRIYDSPKTKKRHSAPRAPAPVVNEIPNPNPEKKRANSPVFLLPEGHKPYYTPEFANLKRGPVKEERERANSNLSDTSGSSQGSGRKRGSSPVYHIPLPQYWPSYMPPPSTDLKGEPEKVDRDRFPTFLSPYLQEQRLIPYHDVGTDYIPIMHRKEPYIHDHHKTGHPNRNIEFKPYKPKKPLQDITAEGALELAFQSGEDGLVEWESYALVHTDESGSPSDGSPEKETSRTKTIPKPTVPSHIVPHDKETHTKEIHIPDLEKLLVPDVSISRFKTEFDEYLEQYEKSITAARTLAITSLRPKYHNPMLHDKRCSINNDKRCSINTGETRCNGPSNTLDCVEQYCSESDSISSLRSDVGSIPSSTNFVSDLPTIKEDSCNFDVYSVHSDTSYFAFQEALSSVESNKELDEKNGNSDSSLISQDKSENGETKSVTIFPADSGDLTSNALTCSKNVPDHILKSLIDEHKDIDMYIDEVLHRSMNYEDSIGDESSISMRSSLPDVTSDYAIEISDTECEVLLSTNILSEYDFSDEDSEMAEGIASEYEAIIAKLSISPSYSMVSKLNEETICKNVAETGLSTSTETYIPNHPADTGPCNPLEELYSYSADEVSYNSKVSCNSTEEISGDSTEKISGNSAEDISLPSADVSYDSAEDVSGNSAEDVSGDSAEDISSNSAEDVSGDSAEDVSGNSAEDVSGNSAEDVSDNSAEEVFCNYAEEEEPGISAGEVLGISAEEFSCNAAAELSRNFAKEVFGDTVEEVPSSSVETRQISEIGNGQPQEETVYEDCSFTETAYRFLAGVTSEYLFPITSHFFNLDGNKNKRKAKATEEILELDAKCSSLVNVSETERETTTITADETVSCTPKEDFNQKLQNYCDIISLVDTKSSTILTKKNQKQLTSVLKKSSAYMTQSIPKPSHGKTVHFGFPITTTKIISDDTKDEEQSQPDEDFDMSPATVFSRELTFPIHLY